MSTAEALASILTLGRLGPAGICGAWVESAGRRCSKPADPGTWLCPRHAAVARRRIVAQHSRDAARAERSAAKRARLAPQRQAELDRIERRLGALWGDGLAAVNAPLRQRFPSDATIAEAAALLRRAEAIRGSL